MKHARIHRWLPISILVSLEVAACGGASKDDYVTKRGAAGAGSGPVIDLGGSGGSGPSAGPDGTGATGTTCANANLNGCVGEVYEGEGGTLDIYIMFDQSGSMASDVGGITRLAAVQQAAAAFLSDPKSAHLGVGIGYFGFQPIGQVSCDSATYATPDVGVTLDHAQVVSSLNARMPTGETPTAAAIDGACGYASAWRREHPTHSVVILLITDGIPEAPASCAGGGCCPALADAVKAASDCVQTGVHVPTYVLGVGPELGNLNQIAAAGGTHEAYLVGDQNVSKSVLDALDTIRGAAIPCDLEIPQPDPGQTLDFSQVNVLQGTSDCSAPLNPIYYVTTQAQCDASTGGWYYDDPNAPQRVELCSASCAQVSQPDATLRFSVGCQSLPPPVR
jgi:Mg-chelatase subunit ChlD